MHFLGILYLGPQGYCALKFLHALEIDQGYLAHTPTGQSINGAERAKTRVERSGAVSGSQKNRAEREREDRGAGTERGAD